MSVLPIARAGRWLDQLIPEGLRNAPDPEDAARARVLVQVTLLLLTVGALGGWIAGLNGSPLSARITWLSMLVWAAVLPILWATGSIAAAGFLVTLGIFADLVAHNWWIWGPFGLVPLFCVPLSSLVLRTGPQAWGWAALACVSIWPLAQEQALRVSSVAPPTAVSAFTAFACTAVVFLVFASSERRREAALAGIREARQRAEEATVRAESEQARFRALAEDSYQTIIETDGDGLVCYANPACYEVLGYRPEELIGRHPSFMLADPETRAKAGAVRGVVQPGSRFDLMNRKQDGQVVVQEIVASRYVDPTGSERWIFAGRDVTHERAENEHVREVLRLESLGVLAGGIAHDFNNLLTVILGTAEELPESDAARQIGDAGQRAAELTGKLLAFGRKQVLRLEVTTLNDLVGDMEPLLRSLLREDTSVEISLADDPWPIRVDPGQMHQVLVNLATNARDAMPLGGALQIESGHGQLDETEAARLGVPTGEYAWIVLSDTGSGMDDATRERAFEPFFTTKEVGRGTGLGLASVYGIIEQSGGGIALDSRRDSGTSVKVALPRCAEIAEPARSEALSRSSAGRGRRLFLVEDEPAVRRLAARALTRAGYEVFEAESGADALQRLTPFLDEIDLLVTDVILPEMRGPELARRFHELRPDLPVLFVSGYDDQLLGLATDDPDSRFLAKPFTPAELVGAVDELIGAKSAQDPD